MVVGVFAACPYNSSFPQISYFRQNSFKPTSLCTACASFDTCFRCRSTSNYNRKTRSQCRCQTLHYGVLSIKGKLGIWYGSAGCLNRAKDLCAFLALAKCYSPSNHQARLRECLPTTLQKGALHAWTSLLHVLYYSIYILLTSAEFCCSFPPKELLCNHDEAHY